MSDIRSSAFEKYKNFVGSPSCGIKKLDYQKLVLGSVITIFAISDAKHHESIVNIDGVGGDYSRNREIIEDGFQIREAEGDYLLAFWDV